MAPAALSALARAAGRAASISGKVASLGLPARTWALFYGGYFAALLVKALRRALRSSDVADGLDGVVSFSSCLIAAARAAESEREDRFIYDPLASVLAGRKALAKHGLRPRSALLVAHTAPIQPAAPPGWVRPEDGASASEAAPSRSPPRSPSRTKRPAATAPAFAPPARPVPRLAMRTRFFDDAVLAATWGSGLPAPGALSATIAAVDALSDAGHGPCRQVVMLGSGMDTRPWRLPLPPNTSWFEVDKPDVAAAKAAALARAGVQLRGRAQQSSAGGGASAGAAVGQLGQQLGALVPHTFALTAARWAAAACDLGAVGWTAQLELQGLDLLQPTCWVAEGEKSGGAEEGGCGLAVLTGRRERSSTHRHAPLSNSTSPSTHTQHTI